MILLLLTTLTFASDVYEFCLIKNQKWNERYQRFETFRSHSYYAHQPPQFIVHEKSFELNRDSHPIIEKTVEDKNICWREHKNSQICLNKTEGRMYWEWHKKNGETRRDIMYVCKINGE